MSYLYLKGKVKQLNIRLSIIKQASITIKFGTAPLSIFLSEQCKIIPMTS